MIQIYASVDSPRDTEFIERKMVFDLTPINEGLQGYAWHVPCLKNGIPSMAHGICDFRVCPDKPRADMKQIFIRILQARDIHQDPKSWSCHPIRWLSEEAIVSQPNVLLVGDAAGIEPAFGGGIHLALSYGEVAAHVIIDAFQKNDFSFQDYPERIQSHSVGKFIAKCTRLALAMYGGKMNPLDAAREVFSPRHAPSDMMH
jgi:flavin-dependent dehydrogenase